MFRFQLPARRVWASLGKITNTNSALGPQGTAPEEAGALSCDSPKSKNRIKRVPQPYCHAILFKRTTSLGYIALLVGRNTMIYQINWDKMHSDSSKRKRNCLLDFVARWQNVKTQTVREQEYHMTKKENKTKGRKAAMLPKTKSQYWSRDEFCLDTQDRSPEKTLTEHILFSRDAMHDFMYLLHNFHTYSVN